MTTKTIIVKSITRTMATKPTSVIKAEPEFDWTPETVGVVDSSFFWGYIVTQIPGGFLAARYPANRVFGSAIATSAFLNMLLPIAAKAGFQYVMLLRILQGLVEVSFRSHSLSHSAGSLARAEERAPLHQAASSGRREPELRKAPDWRRGRREPLESTREPSISVGDRGPHWDSGARARALRLRRDERKPIRRRRGELYGAMQPPAPPSLHSGSASGATIYIGCLICRRNEPAAQPASRQASRRMDEANGMKRNDTNERTSERASASYRLLYLH